MLNVAPIVLVVGNHQFRNGLIVNLSVVALAVTTFYDLGEEFRF